MERIFSGNSLLIAWTAFMIASPVCYGLLLFWSLKNGQFGDPERSGALPLESGPLEGDSEMEEAAGGDKHV